MPTLIHVAYSEADAHAWLKAHPHDNVRLVPAEAPEPAHVHLPAEPGTRLAHRHRRRPRPRRMSPADFSVCSYVSGDSFGLEEDCDMPLFLQRLDERGTSR